MSSFSKDHWNEIYANSPITQLGWYEDRSYPSNLLIERCAISKLDPIVDVGSGATSLIPELVDLGYQSLYAIDVSQVALEKARRLLGPERAVKVHWFEADITHPATILPLNNAAIWHDRAAFHFLTETGQRERYHALLHSTVRPGGFVIIATFGLDGAERCSGLPVQRYSTESLAEFLGERFSLVESLNYTYRMPSGDVRPYVYGRFQRLASSQTS